MSVDEYIKTIHSRGVDTYHGLINVIFKNGGQLRPIGTAEIWVSKNPPPMFKANLDAEYVWLRLGNLNELLVLIKKDGTVTNIKSVEFRSEKSIVINDNDNSLYETARITKKGLI